MFFDDWQQHTDAKLNRSLLWDHDFENFDFNGMKTLVVQRVIERGWPEDFYAAINMYGGLDNFICIIKDVPVLNDRDRTFVCRVFNLKNEELKCYSHKFSRQRLIDSWSS